MTTGQRKRLAGLLHCAEERRGSSGVASVCSGRACIWASPNEASDYEMASVSGDLAGDDRDDFGIDVLGCPRLRTVRRSAPNGHASAQSEIREASPECVQRGFYLCMRLVLV